MHRDLRQTNNSFRNSWFKMVFTCTAAPPNLTQNAQIFVMNSEGLTWAVNGKCPGDSEKLSGSEYLKMSN